MAVDMERLKERMKEKNVSISCLARELGIDPATVYRKLKSAGESFTVGEMHKIVAFLGLSKDEASYIFLFQNSQ